MTPDIVERLRTDCADITSYECTEWRREAADEITRLRERIAHLERVVAAADALRLHIERSRDFMDFARAYDAVRKGEG